jgi:hypothetical protein
MPQDAPPNGSAPGTASAVVRVAEMQAKLHRWAAADAGRRFDDLFNFVHDPATLLVAFGRVAGNRGAQTPGVDGLTADDVEAIIGVPGFLDDLRAQLKAGVIMNTKPKSKGLGIRFVSLLPQLTPGTALGSAAVRAYAAKAGKSAQQYLQGLGSTPTPSLVAEAVLRLATDDGLDEPAYMLTAAGITQVP